MDIPSLLESSQSNAEQLWRKGSPCDLCADPYTGIPHNRYIQITQMRLLNLQTRELTSPKNMLSLLHNLVYLSFPRTSIARIMSTRQGKELTRRSISTLDNSVLERLTRYFIPEIESEHSSRSPSHAQVAFEESMELLKRVEREL